ncbi:MAG: M48 family metallopeptidase [Pseudomonadales bacterium]|nr:M48 family metallopeptidase [Pseudomonadales bacterium]
MINGLYMDGKTSKQVQARLEVLTDINTSINIYIEGAPKEEVFNLTFQELKIESRLGNTPREISFGDNQLFITDNNDAIDALVKSQPSSLWPRVLHKLETSLPLVIAATLLTFACVWLTIDIGIPKSAKYIAYQLPEFTAKNFGSTLTILDKTLFDATELDLEKQQAIHDLAQPYLQHYQDLNPKLVFRSGQGANAFALPDGHIIFTDAMIKLVDDDDELLAILFHELGHLKHKHLIRRTLQDSMVTLLIILMTGDVDGFDMVTGIPTLLLDLSYSKEFEREADYFAIQQLHRNQLDVESFATVMKRFDLLYSIKSPAEVEGEKNDDSSDNLETLKSIVEFLSTHPATHDRVAMVAEYKKQHKLN